MADLDDELLGTADGVINAEIKIEAPVAPKDTAKAPVTASAINLPKLMGKDFPEEYSEVVERILVQYKNLPELDEDALYAELRELSVKSSPTPTLPMINSELERVQAAKDRLSEIFVNVNRCNSLKKRAVDILRDSWGKFSSEGSADKRKGDAAFRLSDFEIDLALTDSLVKACSHVIKNLDSLHDSLSRRITIIQLQLKLHDIGRGALPSFDFDKDSYASLGDAESNANSANEAIDENQSLPPKDLSF